MSGEIPGMQAGLHPICSDLGSASAELGSIPWQESKDQLTGLWGQTEVGWSWEQCDLGDVPSPP